MGARPGAGPAVSKDAGEYTKQLALRTGRHVDPLAAVQDLFGAWSRQEVTARRDKTLALRLAATCTHDAAANTAGQADSQHPRRRWPPCPG